MERVADEVVRPQLLASYKNNMLSLLTASTKCSPEEAMAYIESQMTRLKNPAITCVENPRDGVAKVVSSNLGNYLQKYNKDIITPSGTVYKPAHVEEAFLSTMTKEGLLERKTLKKKQFAAEESGEKMMVRKYKCAQTTVKVRLNSLPGGYGSAYNVFYCKAGYNSITSSARAMIAHSYTTAENTLGGNFAWFNVTEALNWAILCNRLGPPHETIQNAITKYNIRAVSAEDVVDYMTKTVMQYKRRDNFGMLAQYIRSLPWHVHQFIYYASNLRHLFWANESIFRPIIQDILTPIVEVDPSVDPKDIHKFDGDMMPIVYTILSPQLADTKHSELVDKHPNLARLCVQTAKSMDKKLRFLDDLFETFIYHNIMTPNILTRKAMIRNTVIISDTDSVIFTSKDWAEWFVGHLNNIDVPHFSISALVTYWLTKANDDAMSKFSIAQGATKENTKIMRMKNEFLYPALILYDTKKTYAGLIKIQEGVNLPKPKPDIKGAVLKGSTIAEDSLDFIEDLIINDIVIPATKGDISGIALIDKVIAFEQAIRESLAKGELTYLPKQTVKMDKDYDNPEGSVWAYCDAWNAVFGDKYGIINPPDKVPLIKLCTITPQYLEWLNERNPSAYKKYLAHVGDKKQPSAIVLHSLCRSIPEELIPLINVRHIIFSNLKPAYLTLERLGIAVGHDKRQLLLGDIYGS